jgi:hypothetical protein
MVRRRKYYSSQPEWDETTMSFPIHALYFLAELRAYESLTTILNILRQDEEFLESWFSIELHDYFYPCIYFLGNTQLPLLQAFAIEQNNFNYSRNIVSDIAAQTALRQPERRDEVLAWFKTVMQTHLNQPKNDGLIDTTFISSLVSDCIRFNAIELEPEIIALYENGWIQNGMSGDLTAIKASLRDPDEFSGRYEPLPISIQEMYNNKYSDKMEDFKFDVEKTVQLNALDLDDPYNDFLTERIFSKMAPQRLNRYDEKADNYYAPPQETIRRVDPKIGRNDPCPCGSGKKYKKCHGA